MKALYKDSLREIKKKFKIFLSILFMALLGVGFFAGIRATTPDMQKTLDSYFKDLNVMDMNILSPSGFTEHDRKDVDEISYVKDVSLVNTIDVVGTIKKKDYTFKTITYDENINQIELVSGRFPKNESECVLDSIIQNVEIGDTVSFHTEEGRIKNKNLTVVGFVKSPLYISKDRGTTTLSSGTIDYFLYMPKDNVLGDIYTDMYITLNTKADRFSEEYSEYVERAKEELKNVNSNWYLFDIEDNTGFSSYQDDTYRVENIAKIFPIIFFVVAILISLTSMTRMVEEQRGEIGTLKSLGYSNTKIAGKYILYASLATLIGGVLGIIIGINIIPRIIYMMYQMMYDTKDLIVGYNITYSLLGLIISYICIVGAVIFACVKEMRNNPAILMRPKSPKAGKRIFLEKIPFIWKRLNFTNKVTCRNIFRYKKRFLMTIIGIMGCTALIFAGFGLKDSIGNVLPLQYGKVFKYDVQAILKEEVQKRDLELLDSQKEISSYTLVRMESATVEFKEKNNKDVQIMVVDDDIKNYISLGEDNFQDGIYITKKLAKLMNIKENDEISLQNANGVFKKVKVSKIVENYLRHYVYMDKELYQDLFNKESSYNVALINVSDSKEEEKMTKDLLKSNLFSKVILTSDIAQKLDDTLNNMDYVVWVLIVSAGILALTVLYNLSNVNISERIRELATIKVLGFYDREVYNYVSKENNLLTLMGILLGLWMGYFLTLIIIKTCELDILLFPTNIGLWCYIVSILITLLFTMIVKIMNYFSLKRINMTTSLKSVE